MADLYGTADVTIFNDDGTKAVAIITDDSSVNRLATSAAIAENVATVSTLNSTTDIAAGATWSGTFETIVNQAAIQFILIYDQNTIIYVEQSLGGSVATITDTFFGFANVGVDRAIVSVAPYYRIRVTNLNGSTKATGAIVSAKTAMFNVLPRTLDYNNNLRVAAPIDDVGFKSRNSPMNEQRISEHVKLCGEDFEGATLDTNFWSSTVTGSGSATLTAGEMVLATGTTTASTSLLRSVRSGRYVGGCPNYYRSVLRCPAVTGINTRRWGAFSTTDGFFFEHDGTTLSIVTRISSSDTPVASGSFNGNQGNTYVVGVSVLTYEIVWTNSTVWFFINNELLHKVSQSTAMVSGTLSLPVAAQIINGANVNNNQLVLRTATVNRIGKLEHERTYYNITTAATTVLKRGPGRLYGITDNANKGKLTIYDNTAASGTIIAANIDMTKAIGYIMFDCPFHIGLTLVSTDAAHDSTVIYE